jgi:tetratricopeptide (TPR) repeat protein
MNLDRDLQARDFGNRASLALEAGLFDEAFELISRSIHLNPQASEMRIIQAKVELAMHRPAGAIAALDHHDLYAPHRRDLPEVACLRAMTMIQSKKIFKAQQLLGNVVKDAPDCVTAHRLLAQCLLATHQKIDAIRHLSQVVVLDPADVVSTRTLATLVETSNPRQSLTLMLSLPMDAQTPDELLYIARLHHRLEQLREAEAIYASLIESEISDPCVFIEAGKLADEMGENERAVKRLEQVTTCSEPIAYEANCELALVHMHGGRFDQAGLCWWKASRLDRPNPRAWAGLLVCSLASGKASLVGKTSDILDQRCNPITRRNLVSELWAHAACGKTINQHTKADTLEMQPIATPLQTLLSHASGILAEHANKFPGRADTFYHLANCQQAMDEKSDALASVKQAIQINPNYATAKRLEEHVAMAA